MTAMFDFITGEGLLVVSIESRFDTSRSIQVYSINSSTNLAWRTKSIHPKCFSCSRANYTWREWHFCTISVRVHIGSILYRNDRFPWGMGRGEIATHGWMLVRKKGGGRGEKTVLSSLLSLCTLPLPSPLDSPKLLNIFRIQCCSHTSKKICAPEESACNWILWVLPTVITRYFAFSPLSCFTFTHTLHIYIHFILFSGLKCNLSMPASSYAYFGWSCF